MPKPRTKPDTSAFSPKEKSYTLMPWSCNHYPTYSEIEAYLPVTGNFEMIADIHDTKGVQAEIVANLITRAVNSYDTKRELIGQMASALELCLECGDCLTWEAEHDAQAVLKRADEINRRPG